MSRLRIRNCGPLQAELRVQGSKNSSLPCLAAALLHPGTTVLEGVPMIEDVATAIEILRALGAGVWTDEGRITICANDITNTRIPVQYMKKMRSSAVFMGALLARMKNAEAVYPGGCVLGNRPINFHLEGFQRLGCDVAVQEDVIIAKTAGMTGTGIKLPFPSVGATENLMLAAVGAEGTTMIENAAKEPEVIELARFLNRMGLEVSGAGTSKICIRGGQKTHDIHFCMSGDRIAAGTWLLCCMNAGGSLWLDNVPVSWMRSTLSVLEQMGASLRIDGTRLECTAPQKIRAVKHLKTAPYPGFPTDMQSQLLPVLCRADEDSCICETVFSSRFCAVRELVRMGARITVDQEKNLAWVQGGVRLHGADVSAPDLRAGAALVIAAMGAGGDTIIDNFYHIERGYERITDTIRILGGEACWIC